MARNFHLMSRDFYERGIHIPGEKQGRYSQQIFTKQRKLKEISMKWFLVRNWISIL